MHENCKTTMQETTEEVSKLEVNCVVVKEKLIKLDYCANKKVER